jgi:hypothetical protein
MAFESILKGLQNKELILPFLDNQILADKWPDKYTIEIDSSPYYGLDEDGKPDGYFHPSTHSLMGERELYLSFHPDTRDKMVREPNSRQRQWTLGMGSSLHGILQTQLQMTGLCPPENIEVEYIIAEHYVRGRIDLIFQHPSKGDIVVEAKSRTGYKFDKSTIEDMPSWDAQLSLAEYSQDKTEGVLLMMESAWPYRLRELPHKRNDAMLQQIFDRFDYVRLCLEAGETPRHCCAYDSPQMTSCQARFECWMKP